MPGMRGRAAPRAVRYGGEAVAQASGGCRRRLLATKRASRCRVRGGVMSELLFDAAGRRRSPATMPGFHAGRPPRNKGIRYPAGSTDGRGDRRRDAYRGRLGSRPQVARTHRRALARRLRIHQALALNESDLDPRRGALVVRRGKGGRRREVSMDDWAGSTFSPGASCVSICRSARCSAPSPDRRAVDHGPPQRSVRTFAARPPGQACADASRRISCGTLMPSRWRMKVCR